MGRLYDGPEEGVAEPPDGRHIPVNGDWFSELPPKDGVGRRQLLSLHPARAVQP